MSHGPPGELPQTTAWETLDYTYTGLYVDPGRSSDDWSLLGFTLPFI